MDRFTFFRMGKLFSNVMEFFFLIGDYEEPPQEPDFYSLASRYKKRVTTIKPEKQNRTRTFQVFNVIFVLNLLCGSSWYYIMFS